MRFSLKQIKNSIRQGFTLVEMLVIAPIVIIVITGLVAAMVAMVGDALAANGRATSAYNTQDALDRIEQDVRVSMKFLGTFSFVESPQGRNADTTAFSSSSYGDLILTQQATTASPYSSERNLVYYANQPAVCGTDANSNRTLKVRTIYFLKNNSLWRRVLVNNWNLNATADTDTVCASPWQRDTCPEGSTMGATPTATCNTMDEELLKNVTAFTTTYYLGDGSTTTDPLLANSVEVRLTTAQSVSGESVNQSMTMRAQKRNDVTADVDPPETPVISAYNDGIEQYQNAVTVSLQWNSIGASSYRVQTSSDNGATWGTAYLTTQNWVSIPVHHSGVTAKVRVTAYNDAGTSATAEDGAISPLWTTITAYDNGWACYNPTGTTWACPSYTVTSTGMVLMRGLIKSGTIDTTAFTLPDALKPYQRLIFPVSSASLSGRVDVLPAGNVNMVIGASNNYISLDGVRYLAPQLSGATWANATIATANKWQLHPTTSYGSPTYVADSQGRVFVFSMLTGTSAVPATTTNGANVITIPSPYAPTWNGMLPGLTVSAAPSTVQTNLTSLAIQSRGQFSGGTLDTWSSFNTWYYRSDMQPTWTNVTLSNSWTHRTDWQSGGYAVRDGIVSLRGLLKGGTCAADDCILVAAGVLPASARPAYRQAFTVVGIKSGGATTDQVNTRIDVLADGSIRFHPSGAAASNTWVSLEGISYTNY